MDLNGITLVQTRSDLERLVDLLARTPHVAVDTESNSFYAYFNRICLIQISAGEDDYIIDPFSVGDIAEFGEILRNPEIEKVFHAAQNDIAGLKRDFKFSVKNIFDTSIAAKMLGHQQLGLAPILYEHFGISLNKKWQRYDWGKRPLKDEQLEYARLDTHFLIPLRHKLVAELEEKNLFDQVREAFAKVCETQVPVKHFRPGDFLHILGAQSLDVTGKRILKALYLFRENEARRRDRAPFRILTNDTLLRLALQRPKSLHDFSKIKGIPRNYTSTRAATPLLELIRNADNGEEAVRQG